MSTSEQAEKVSREMTIEDIFRKFPHKSQRLAQEMTNLGLHCVGCHASTWETLEAGVMGHGMTNDDVDKLVDRLNAILEEKVDATTVTITPRAAKKFLGILEEEGKNGWGMRFAEKMGGCNGFEYALDYSEKATEDDITLESHGVEIHINKAAMDRLLGCEIDYIEGLYNSGFKISNPNVSSSCSCGTSHGY